MNLTKTITLFFLLTQLLLATTIVFKDSVKISSNEIRVSDIATVFGDRSEELGSFVVGKSSLPGESRFIGGEQAISFLPLETTFKEVIEVRGAARTKVSTKFRELSILSLKKNIEKLLLDSICWSSDEISFELLEDENRIIKISPEEFNLSIELIRSPYKRGKMRISLVIDQPNFRRVVTVKAFLKVETEVFVATQDLIRGDVVLSSSVTLKKMDISTAPFKTVGKEKSPVGLKIKNIVKSGKILNGRFLQEAPTIERGSVVRIVVPLSTGFLSTRGVARQSGKVGDIIAIENSDSRKIIKATVIKTGVVKVIYGGKV